MYYAITVRILFSFPSPYLSLFSIQQIFHFSPISSLTIFIFLSFIIYYPQCFIQYICLASRSFISLASSYFFPPHSHSFTFMIHILYFYGYTVGTSYSVISVFTFDASRIASAIRKNFLSRSTAISATTLCNFIFDRDNKLMDNVNLSFSREFFS